MTHIPVPYSPHSDDVIAIILLGCFFVSAFVLSKAKRQLVYLGKDFIFHKEQTLTSPTVNEASHILLISIQFCLLVGICSFEYYYNTHSITPPPNYLLLAIYTGAVMLYLLLKWIIYSLLSWTFLGKNIKSRWPESYITIIYYYGLFLLPCSLYLVYFDTSAGTIFTIGFILFLLAKILMLYKWLKFFFTNFSALLLLILYFCAVEIVPFLIFIKVLFGINSFVI